MKRVKLGIVTMTLSGPSGEIEKQVQVGDMLRAWVRQPDASGIRDFEDMESRLCVIRKLRAADAAGAEHVDFEDAEHAVLLRAVLAAPKPHADEAFLDVMRRVRDAPPA